jgi:hypothetical protein
MDQFEYVMVLVSIVIGLGIAHLPLVDEFVKRNSHHQKRASHTKTSACHAR